MSEWGRYRVTGTRSYRDNPPGTTFLSRLDRNAERRAIQRGDIELVERVTPELPARWGLPVGWNTREE